jgi:hypothetical protein
VNDTDEAVIVDVNAARTAVLALAGEFDERTAVMSAPTVKAMRSAKGIRRLLPGTKVVPAAPLACEVV